MFFNQILKLDMFIYFSNNIINLLGTCIIHDDFIINFKLYYTLDYYIYIIKLNE